MDRGMTLLEIAEFYKKHYGDEQDIGCILEGFNKLRVNIRSKCHIANAAETSMDMYTLNKNYKRWYSIGYEYPMRKVSVKEGSLYRRSRTDGIK